LFVFLSSFTIRINPAMYIVVFILMAIITFLIRPLTESYLKPTCYFLLGTLSYWMVARELVVSPGGPEPALFILAGLALLNFLVALTTYSDGETSGQAYIAGSLALLFLNLPNQYTFLSGVLIFAGSSAVVYFIFKITDKSKMSEGIVKAAVVSSLFLYAAALSQFWVGVSVGVYKLPSISLAIFSLLMLSAFSTFSMFLTLTVFEFFLKRFGYRRAIEGEKAAYYPLVQALPAKKKN
jgi:hypothetical protein